MSYAIMASARLARLLPRRLPARASKYPWQPRATRKVCSRCGRDRTKVIPKTLAEAVRRTSSFWPRFEAHPDVAKALSSWQGKTSSM